MASYQPKGEVIILAFPPRPASAATLTARDRLEIGRWHEHAKLWGYDRLVIHERDIDDAPEVGSFLCVYERGKPWARWGLTRRGQKIVAWCCATHADIGAYDSMSEAMLALLPPAGSDVPAEIRTPVAAADVVLRLR